MDLRRLLMEPGVPGDYPAFIRPYTAPLTRSIAGAPGSTLLPSRSGGHSTSAEVLAQGKSQTNWTPWGVFSTILGALLSSGPQAGQPSAPAQVAAYSQNLSLWKLSGVAEGWSRPLSPTPGRPPTAKMAVGTWTPFGGGSAPLPSNPTPGRMLRPSL